MAKARPIQGLDPQAPTGKNARIIARIRLEEMYTWDRYVDNPSNERELHNLRIAAKRLRYTLEVFEDVLPEACKPVIKDVERIQEELGALHDSDVMIALLQLCLQQSAEVLSQVNIALDQQTQLTIGSIFPNTAVSSQNGEIAYEQPLLEAKEQHEQIVLPPELIADLLDPAATPTAQQRHGLEQLLLKRRQIREEQYSTFRQYWHQLQARSFRGELLDILDTQKEGF